MKHIGVISLRRKPIQPLHVNPSANQRVLRWGSGTRISALLHRRSQTISFPESSLPALVQRSGAANKLNKGNEDSGNEIGSQTDLTVEFDSSSLMTPLSLKKNCIMDISYSNH